MVFFKQISNGFIALTLIGALLLGNLHTSLAQAEGINLLQNTSFEASSTDHPEIPEGWHQDSWGQNNANFNYTTDAHSGEKAASVTITNYEDGDAKWRFDTVNVTAGSNYNYNDWYKSSTTTYIWAQFLLNDNTYQYQLLQVAAASLTDWKQVSVSINVPQNVTDMSIFHVLASNGQFTLDDVSLQKNTPCAVSYTNGLANGNFEDTCTDNSTVDGWSTAQYGTTNGSVSTSTSAYQGTHSAAITNVDDGAEVGINTDIQAPLSNQRYAIKFWHSGDTYSYAYLAIGLDDGTTEYKSLMSSPATGNTWSQYNDNFVTPRGTQSLQLTIATSGTGTVKLDDVQLSPLQNQTPETFDEGIVSLTFDDGEKTNYTNGLPILKQYGYKGTFYLNSGSLDTAGYMTSSQVKALADNGQEIGSHLYHHSDIVQIDDETLQSELTGNKIVLQRIIGDSYQISNFASPYGSYTSPKIDTVMQYAQSHRNTDGRLNTKADFNTRQIHGRLVTPETTIADITVWIAEAKQTHSWLVLVYHGINPSVGLTPPNGEEGYNVIPTQFQKQLATINKSGISVLPVQAALAKLQAQL